MSRSLKMRHRGFSLLEVMVAVAVAGLSIAAAVSSFKHSLDEQARAKKEWQAFTIAEQRMELLAALPATHPFLTPNSAAGSIRAGSIEDADCSEVTNVAQHSRVNGLGITEATGFFDLCTKVTAGDPSGNLLNVRTFVTYELGGKQHVVLQTIR